MSQKKLVSRNIAITLGIVCIILVAALGVVAFMGYSPTAINSVPSLQSQITSLNSTYNGYLASHQHTNSEYDAMWDALLIPVDLQGSDLDPPPPWLQIPYLHVTGYVVNVHRNWAFNCRLHVIAYGSDGVVVGVMVDTYISLGTMAGQSYTKVASDVYHPGSSLINWTITPEWTITP